MKHILLSSLFLLFLTGAWANNTLIVDGVGVDTHTYATIQEAIDEASDDDVIEVAAGTYTVTSTIYITTDNLTLRNKEGARPIIRPCSGLDCPGSPDDPPGPQGGKNGESFSLGMIHIHDADGVTLEGFEISGPVDPDGEPEFFFFFQYGVFVESSTSTQINNNIITNFFAGLVIEDSTNQEVKDNTITENWYGVAVFISTDVNINDNNIFDNEPNFPFDNGKGNGNGNGISDLVYSNSTNIDATCNWWGTTDLNQINKQVINFDFNEGQGDDPIVFPFWSAKDGPCLQQMFKLEISTGRQNGR